VEEALRESQQQLHQAQKMETLGTLVAGVAHEINNPINLIMYNLPLIQKIWSDLLPVLMAQKKRMPNQKYGGFTYDFLEDNLTQLVADMDMAANRVAKIVSDLKNFSKQSNVAEKSTVQVNAAVKNAMRLAQTTLRKSGVRIQLDLD
jgi:C4-dicarboxylate-specific signal transduction histidine kinase